MSIEDGVRPSDPDPSHGANKRINRLGKRKRTFEVLCMMVMGELPGGILAGLVVDLEGVVVLTRETIRWVCAQLDGQRETLEETERRRVSDLMEQVFKAGRWTPLVHFDLCEQVLGPDGKQLEHQGFGVIRLTAKGRMWKDFPGLRDWRWPHQWDPMAVHDEKDRVI